jgi:hypothetical protein
VSVHTDIERWLPTVKRARALGPIVVERGWFRDDLNLWDQKIVRTESLAGILMRGRILRRDAWEHDEEISVARWQQLGAAPQPDPKSFATGHFVRPLRSEGEGTCSHCVPSARGRAACPMCNGTGMRSLRSHDSERLIACSSCEAGLVLCSHCDGTGRSLRATLEYVDQRIEAWSSLVLPDVPPKLSFWLHERLLPSTVLPEELRFPLDRMLDSGPYRGSSVSREPEFRGYRFQGAFARAHAALQEITGRVDVLASEYQSYAAPILWVEFTDGARTYDAVFIVDESATFTGYAAVR